MAAPAVKWTGTTALVEAAESGEISYGEKVKLTKIYGGQFSACTGGLVARGAVGTGSLTGWIVAGSKATRARGGLGILTIEFEAGASAPLPPDEVSFTGVDGNPRVERNPRFADISPETLANVQAAVHASNQEQRETAILQFTDLLLVSAESDLAVNLYNKLIEGKETYYLSGAKYSWKTHSYSQPGIFAGGAIQTPGGPLGGIIAAMNADWGWLRQIDEVTTTGPLGTVYALTRSWVGGPHGHWDPDLYDTI